MQRTFVYMVSERAIMKWGRGTDLSSYDLSLYLHGDILASSSAIVNPTLADRRPWKASYIHEISCGSLLAPGIVVTSPVSRGLYFDLPVVGIYSQQLPGYFEVEAKNLQILKSMISGSCMGRSYIRVNGVSTTLELFASELAFWGLNREHCSQMVSFELVAIEGDVAVVQRLFDQKRYRVGMSLVEEMKRSPVKCDGIVEKLLV